MKTIDEKLHPISVWCIYSRYFAKDFREHCGKFNSISQTINRRLAKNNKSDLIGDDEIIEYSKVINKYIDFSKPILRTCYGGDWKRKLEGKDKEEKIRKLRKESLDLLRDGDIAGSEVKIELVKQLKKELKK